MMKEAHTFQQQYHYYMLTKNRAVIGLSSETRCQSRGWLLDIMKAIVMVILDVPIIDIKWVGINQHGGKIFRGWTMIMHKEYTS